VLTAHNIGQPFAFAMIADGGQSHKETTALQGIRSLGLPIRDGRISIPASKVYASIREVISNTHPNGFQPDPAYHWPTCFINDENARGFVQFKPLLTDGVSFLSQEVLSEQQARMWAQVSQMDDANADVYDALMAIWLYQAGQAGSPDHTARGTVEMILAMRGVKRKLSGNKRRGGFSQSQIEDVLMRLSHLQNVWVDFGDVPIFEQADGKGRRAKKRIGIQSRALAITDAAGQRKLDGTVEATTFLFCPGKLLARYLFDAGYTTALLSIRALNYNSRTQKWEKRVTRYLAWQWRVRAYQGDYMQPFSVKTMLENGCRETYNRRRAAWQHERFERMLDTICDPHDPYRPADGWQYDPTSLQDTAGASRQWIEWRVLIEPPSAIRAHYQTIQKGDKSLPLTGTTSLGTRLLAKRQRLGLNLLCAAEQIGISSSQLSRIETAQRGKRPTKQMALKLEEWLQVDG
jgi:hypothetical protein